MWIQRAIDINPLPNYYDTRAHLLYRQGSLGEAVIAEETAVRLGTAQNFPESSLSNYRSTLQKMRDKTLDNR